MAQSSDKTRPLSKTQQALLAKARESRLQTISVESCVGRGPGGGQVSFGRREMDAAVALRDRGLLVQVNLMRDRRSERGYGTQSTVLVLRLPETAKPSGGSTLSAENA